MQDDLFSFTTQQAARALGASVEAMRAQFQRTGSFRGAKPVKLPNGRLLWPRAEVLAISGRHVTAPRTTIDLRATNPWIESLGLPPCDPAVQVIAISLNDPRDDARQNAQYRLDEWWALRGWMEAATKRMQAARTRLSAEQWTDAQRLMGRAVAAVVADLDAATLQQSVLDFLGGAT